MKKRVRVLVLVLLAVLLVAFVPIPTGVMKDGGTRQYCALAYTVVKWNRLLPVKDETSPTYQKTCVYWFPTNFRSIDELWESEYPS